MVSTRSSMKRKGVSGAGGFGGNRLGWRNREIEQAAEDRPRENTPQGGRRARVREGGGERKRKQERCKEENKQGQQKFLCYLGT